MKGTNHLHDVLLDFADLRRQHALCIFQSYRPYRT